MPVRSAEGPDRPRDRGRHAGVARAARHRRREQRPVAPAARTASRRSRKAAATARSTCGRSKSAAIRSSRGDIVVTSGTGGLYPPLVPVARVVRLDDDGAIALPLADPAIDQLRHRRAAYEPAAVGRASRRASGRALMVRAALARDRSIGQGPSAGAAYVPAISVMVASLLTALPIVSTSGWYPDLGFLMLIAWRLLRPEIWPAWWAAPLGFFNDLMTGAPIGLSIALWTAAMLVLDLIDRRTMWRDYWLEWALAALLAARQRSRPNGVLRQIMGAPLPFVSDAAAAA